MAAVLGQGPCHVPKGQADVPGRVNLTGMSGMVGLMAAVAEAEADVVGFLYDMAGPLLV